MWKKYWKFNDWVFEKVTGEKVDSRKNGKKFQKDGNVSKKNHSNILRLQVKIFLLQI